MMLTRRWRLLLMLVTVVVLVAPPYRVRAGPLEAAMARGGQEGQSVEGSNLAKEGPPNPFETASGDIVKTSSLSLNRHKTGDQSGNPLKSESTVSIKTVTAEESRVFPYPTQTGLYPAQEIGGPFPNCAFCHVREIHEKVPVVKGPIWETENSIGFLRPESLKLGKYGHFLIVPKNHIFTPLMLETVHLPILREMGALGKKLLGEVGGVPVEEGGSNVMGFHIPPGGSVPHLHLHVIDTRAGPAEWEQAKYNLHTYPFLSLDEAIQGIESKGSLRTYWDEKISQAPFKPDWSATIGKHSDNTLWGDQRPRRIGDPYTRIKKRNRIMELIMKSRRL